MTQNTRSILKAVLLSVVVTCVVVIAIQLVTRWLTGKSSSSMVASVGIPVALIMLWTMRAAFRKPRDRGPTG